MKVAAVIGTRPQYIKHWAMEHYKPDDIDLVTIDTRQHESAAMSTDIISSLGMHGNYISSSEHITDIMKAIGHEDPDVVLIYGDTRSAVIGSVAAYELGIPIAHIEAGLRHGDTSRVEERNRILIDYMADSHFCPDDASAMRVDGLVVGDVMYDTFKNFYPGIPHMLRNQKYSLLTLHRQELVDSMQALEDILETAANISERSGSEVVWITHPRLNLSHIDTRITRHHAVCSPVPYDELLSLLKGAAFVMTDSGGLQREAIWAGKPCIVMRNESEWGDLYTGYYTLLDDFTSIDAMKTWPGWEYSLKHAKPVAPKIYNLLRRIYAK